MCVSVCVRLLFAKQIFFSKSTNEQRTTTTTYALKCAYVLTFLTPTSHEVLKQQIIYKNNVILHFSLSFLVFFFFYFLLCPFVSRCSILPFRRNVDSHRPISDPFRSFDSIPREYLGKSEKRSKMRIDDRSRDKVMADRNKIYLIFPRDGSEGFDFDCATLRGPCSLTIISQRLS